MTDVEDYATRREFDDFRDETRDELKFLRRLLITTLTSAVGGGLLASGFVILRTP